LTENKPDKKISSARRIAASRANGAKSRGPVTAEGKMRSSQNALKHGLASATIVLTTEDWPNYLACRDAYIRRFQPADDIELDLVEEMVAARWRQQRMWAVESAALDDQLDAQRADVDQTYTLITPDVRTALAFVKLADESRALALINRYESRYSRQFYRALKALKELQSNRPPQTQPSQNAPVNTNPPAPVAKTPNEPNPNSGHSPQAPAETAVSRPLPPAACPPARPVPSFPAAFPDSSASAPPRRFALARSIRPLAAPSAPQAVSPPSPPTTRSAPSCPPPPPPNAAAA
jgi:hypothetical protein